MTAHNQKGLGGELQSFHELESAGSPLDLVQPETLRFKVKEPVALLGEQRFQNVDIRIRVKGGGHVSQVYGERPSHISLKHGLWGLRRPPEHYESVAFGFLPG